MRHVPSPEGEAVTVAIGSLFSGIGGLELGLERAIPSAHVAWQVELDPFCRSVLARHWPHAERHSDVRTVGAHNLTRADVICGGFPCQGLSAQGHRAGLDDERSGLWWEFARIICELRPRVVVVENVPGLLRMGIEHVLGFLAECGFDAEWSVLRARDLGAAHTRARLFILAYPAQVRREAAAGVLPREPSLDVHQAPFHFELARTFRSGLRAIPDSRVLRMAHGTPDRVDAHGAERVAALGNAVVPQVAAVVGARVAQILAAQVAA
jgi:DNA (cytosine-5)-methyltransferase 1